MLPNFLVIGPGKSGTTWMYYALQDHPEVCVSSAKETLFFESEFYRGKEWYSKYFSHCSTKNKAIGEASNTYIFSSKAAERIYSFNSKMKLITCLRNPVVRTFSHYLFLVRGGQVTTTFRETLKEYPHLIEKGKYYKNLKPYFNFFDEEQLCIKLFDDLKDDQIKFIQSIYKFLKVNASYVPTLEKKNRLSAAKPRNRSLALAAKKGARFLRKMGFPELLTKIKYSSITKYLFREYGQGEKPTINEDDKAYLKDCFKDDVKKLSNKLNLNLRTIWEI